MKLRQKLAVVLAASMAFTAVPVITMASTSNKVVKASTIIEKDKITTGATLRVKFEQEIGAKESQEFYLELSNAEWLKGTDTSNGGDNADGLSSAELLKGAGFQEESIDSKGNYVFDESEWTMDTTDFKVTFVRQSDTVVKVLAEPKAALAKDKSVDLPLPFKAKGGDVSVAVKGEGSDSIITEGSYKVMTTGEKAANLTMDSDTKTFYDNGELTKMVLKETFLNSFQKDMILKVQLNDPDFEFKSSDVKVKGTYGFNFSDTSVKYEIDNDDKSVMYIYIPQSMVKTSTARNSLGRLEITGLLVDNDEKDIDEGNLTADIKSVKYGDLSKDLKAQFSDDNISIPTDNDKYSELDKDYKDTTVATITNYGALIEMKDSKAVDIKAGRQEDVEFTVKEAVDDVFVGNREITLTLQNSEDKTGSAFFMVPRDIYNKAQKSATSDDVINAIDDSDGDSTKIIKSVKFELEDDDDAKTGTGYTDYWQKQDVVRVKAVKVTLADKKVKTSTDTTSDDGKALNKNNTKDKFKVKLPVYVPVDQQDKKTIKVVGEMRGVDEFKAADAVNVIDPFDVTFAETTLKVGLQNQVAGNITLKELDKEMLEKGNLYFNVTKGSNLSSGIVIEDKGDLTVTGDLKKTDFDTADSDKSEKVELKRQSKAASTLAIDNMKVTVDRTVPEGYYDIELSGDAIDKYNGTYKVEKYIKIGTANTQDITNANGLAAATAVFTIGSTTYTVNGTEFTMDAPAYIAGAGYTMIPMRYVANAFGVSTDNILYSNGTATFFAGTRTIQLTTGSDVALVNGAAIKMSTKVVNKDGRIFIPVGEIANILSISKSWDATAKTATFSNVNTAE